MTRKTDDDGAENALSYRDVVEILRLVEASAFCESLVLETRGIKIQLTRAAAADGPGGDNPEATSA